MIDEDYHFLLYHSTSNRNVREALERLQGGVLDYFFQERKKMQEDMMYA